MLVLNMEKELKNSYEIFLNIYNLIKDELSNIITYENTKICEEIEIKDIINIICSSINLDLEIKFKSYYENIYLSTFKKYDEFIYHYVENSLFIYVLQNDKFNIYKNMLKEYFKNVIEGTNGLINKSPNIFSNTKFYFNIYKTIHTSNDENKILNVRNIGNVLTPKFYILSIIYIFSEKKEYLDMLINTILEKEYVVEIIKIGNNMTDIISYTIINNQFEIYEYILSKYFEIIQKYQRSNLFSMDYNKAKYELKKVILNLNNNIVKKINILSYYKVILSYFTKDELSKMYEYKELTNDIKTILNKNKDINIIYGYFDLIGYDKYDFNETNYSNKIYILIYISVNIDYKDGVTIYEQLNIKDKNKYFVSYLEKNFNLIISLYKMNHKYIYIESILKYLLNHNVDYINRFLNHLTSSNFENYKDYFIGIQNFIINPIIFTLLNDESHIKLLTIIFLEYQNNKEIKQNVDIYIKNMKDNQYVFSNIELNIDSTDVKNNSNHKSNKNNKNHKNNINNMNNTNNKFINIIYENDKDVLLYILNNCETINCKLIINLCNKCINEKNMDFFYILFTNFFKTHNIDLYNGIIANIDNNHFITYIQNNETIRNELQKYVTYKKDYLINIDKTEHSLKNCKCKCNICDSFYLDSNHDYKNNDDYNPVFYYCNECNMNIHNECLFKIIKNHRGQIKKCMVCQSNTLKYIKLNTFEFKYIIYNKLLNNFEFTIQSLE